MSFVNSRQIGLFGGSQIPQEGLKSVGPLVFDWTTKGIAGNPDGIAIDLRTQQTTQALISQALSMFVDNTQCAASVFFEFDSGQLLEFPKSAQGYLPILQGNPIRFTASCSLAANITTVMLLNYEITPYIWVP